MAKPARRGPGRPKNPVSKETLLRAAGTAFAERGYAGASMSDIAGRAGIQKASLFHHFATKELLYTEVLTESLARFGALLDDAHLSADDPFLERLDRLSGAVSDYLGGHPQTARLVLREFIDAGPFADGPGGEAIHTILQTAAEFIASGIEDGSLPEQDPRDALLSILGVHLVYFAAVDVTERLMQTDPFDEAALAARRTSVVARVRGLLGAPPPDAA
jgi:AcrR family transcriptional regulator